MSTPVRIALLGSTGSIGRQALQVAERFPDRIRVAALAANANDTLLVEQALAFGVPAVALADEAAASRARRALPDAVEVGTGGAAVVGLAERPDIDVVLNALVGAAGLRASVAALTAGRRLALANKESLVVGGDLVMRHATSGRLLPVDSEHSAIFQCLEGEPREAVSRIWLTASGGPFWGRSRSSMSGVTVEEALAHPRWTMGPKITIDSATLMNKGLEAIEAHFLFDVGYDEITVVIHPQSCVHSMVEFADGSVKAHLGATDMRIPIQYALSYPERWGAPLPPVDFRTLGSLEFDAPDTDAFPCLELAIAAGRVGGTMPAAMNAANEIAVGAFLDGAAAFLDIPRVVEHVMTRHDPVPLESVEHVEAVDEWARSAARAAL
ncbi:MAG: 1-deoxy-D-xylulose-5-phosphate reductoisomerase [Anaerosomatales bacterium]|nr:1-deoxy-D-xylulose-5-phosphate reductoisomerase [Anaerosomatales bacterium]